MKYNQHKRPLLKSFQQFLHEFEIEGQHQVGERYNGSKIEILHQFMDDLSKTIAIDNKYETVVANELEYSMFLINIGTLTPVTIDVSIVNDILSPIITFDKRDDIRIDNIIQKIKKSFLNEYMDSEEQDIDFHHLYLNIPVNVVK